MHAPNLATDYAVPTGEYLVEWLEESQTSQAELARRMGISAKHVSKLISGSPLSAEVATKLELVTGVPARIWLSYEATYRADVARLGMTEELAKEKDLAAAFPLAHLRALKIVTSSLRKPGNVVMELFAFFGVGSIDALQQRVQRQAVAFRQGTAHAVDEYALATWLRLGELEAMATADQLPAYDADALVRLIPSIRQLAANPTPEFGARLVKLLHTPGVHLIYVPEVKGARVYGATRWVNDQPVIALTLRGRTDGQFWFTLFHEIGHVLLHRDGRTHIRPVNADGEVDRSESEANTFAGDTLIPSDRAEGLRELRSKQDVVRFATDAGVSPGVVVGRLWHDQLWAYTQGHDLCLRLRFNDGD